jgi:hypothetical protein
MNADGHTVKPHFENRGPEVKATYAAILKAAKGHGAGEGRGQENPETRLRTNNIARAKAKEGRHCTGFSGSSFGRALQRVILLLSRD